MDPRALKRKPKEMFTSAATGIRRGFTAMRSARISAAKTSVRVFFSSEKACRQYSPLKGVRKYFRWILLFSFMKKSLLSNQNK